MLQATRKEYDRQQRLIALAVNQALRFKSRGSAAIAQTVTTYQAAAISLSLEALDGVLSEQGIATAAESTVSPTSLLTGTQAVASMVQQASTEDAVARLVQTFVRDAGRTARSVDMATRPAVTGYVRSLNPPSCGRCAVLAGRVYRYSQGFLRHPRCDCLMTPTNQNIGPSLLTDPMRAFEEGRIRGLSAADTEAVRNGADVGQVVNVRRRQAGLTVGSSVLQRTGRLTPHGCLSLASDRTEALALLRRYRYIT